MNTEHLTAAAWSAVRKPHGRFADAHHPAGYRRSMPSPALSMPCPASQPRPLKALVALLFQRVRRGGHR